MAKGEQRTGKGVGAVKRWGMYTSREGHTTYVGRERLTKRIVVLSTPLLQLEPVLSAK